MLLGVADDVISLQAGLQSCFHPCLFFFMLVGLSFTQPSFGLETDKGTDQGIFFSLHLTL